MSNDRNWLSENWKWFVLPLLLSLACALLLAELGEASEEEATPLPLRYDIPGRD